MPLTPDDVRSLLAAFDSSPWQEMTLQVGTDRVHVSRRSGHRVNAGVASAAPAEVTVRSPSVGLFRRGGVPGAPMTVDVGSVVRAGDFIGAVDVMGRMIPVAASVAGTLRALLADDGATVEYGEPLALLVADQGD